MKSSLSPKWLAALSVVIMALFFFFILPEAESLAAKKRLVEKTTREYRDMGEQAKLLALLKIPSFSSWSFASDGAWSAFVRRVTAENSLRVLNESFKKNEKNLYQIEAEGDFRGVAGFIVEMRKPGQAILITDLEIRSLDPMGVRLRMSAALEYRLAGNKSD